MGERKNKETPLKALITEMLRRNGLEKKYNQLDIVEAYHKEVGSLISRHTRNVYLRERTLVVQPDSAVIKQELMFARTALMQAINARMGKECIDEIEIR